VEFQNKPFFTLLSLDVYSHTIYFVMVLKDLIFNSLTYLSVRRFSPVKHSYASGGKFDSQIIYDGHITHNCVCFSPDTLV